MRTYVSVEILVVEPELQPKCVSSFIPEPSPEEIIQFRPRRCRCRLPPSRLSMHEGSLVNHALTRFSFSSLVGVRFVMRHLRQTADSA